MRAILSRPRGRNTLFGAVLAASLLLVPAFPAAAQQPEEQQEPQPQAQPQPQPEQQAPQLAFDGDAGLLFMQVKPDKTAEFEAVMAKLHEALSQTDKPERRQQASSWKVFKSTDPGPGGNVFYVAVMDPVLKGADYTFAMILFEVFPTEVQQIFPIFRDAFVPGGFNRVNLSLVQDFGGPIRPAPPLPAPAEETATMPQEETGAAGTTGVDPEEPETSEEDPR